MLSPDRRTELSPHSSTLPAVGRKGLDYEGFFYSFRLILNPQEIFPKVVTLTIHEDIQYQVDAAMEGASAYVTKRRMHSEFIPL